MTVIAVQTEETGSILIAADSGETVRDTGLRLRNEHKIQQQRTAPMARAGMGSPEISIRQFTPWLKAQSWPPPDWVPAQSF